MSELVFHMIGGAPDPVAPFSHAVEANGWVFVTGQMPFTGTSNESPYPDSIEDQTSLEYRNMRDALWGALAAQPPLAWAAGHEHALQVIESERYGRVLVSGAGIYDHEGHVDAVPGSLYQASRAGYQRIDFLHDGTRRLGVVEVAKDGSSREAFAKVIEPVAAAR